MPAVQIFLSTVSAEFQSYREALRRDLDRPNVTVKIQEDFIASGSATLDKLDDYIRQCDAVIHLVGDMTGAVAEAPSLASIQHRYPDLPQRLPALRALLADTSQPTLSYTQWEAWLALYHHKTLLIAVPHDSAVRDPRYQRIEAQRAAQQAHLARLAQLERFPEIRFTSADRLVVELLRSGLHDIVARAGSVQQAVHLPNKSLGALFVGREDLLEQMAERLGPVPQSGDAAAEALVLSGLSGSGKTRLAIEYAWRHAARHSAVLFATANSPQALRSNMAAWCGPAVLNLPEQRSQGEDAQFEAVLRWLRLHPGWLLILDNLDSEDDAQAAEALLPQFMGGQVLLTSTLGFWSGAVTVQGVGVLDDERAVALLLERTAGRRRVRPDDAAAAAALAHELGGLPLALEQAAAYINTRRLALSQYLLEWRNTNSSVLSWFDRRLMGCEHSVATTWQTAFDQLGAAARDLLAQLAWLDASPIPEAALDHAGLDGAAFGALSELEGQSLVSRGDTEPHECTVHRLVQHVTRHRQAAQGEDRGALERSLRWMDAAFTADPVEHANWPELEGLAMHARAVSLAAADAGIGAPADTLMQRVGHYQRQRQRFADAEALMGRAIGLLRERLGPGDAAVGRAERTLGMLYLETSRHAQARPLFESALAIAEAHPGPGAADLGRALRAMAVWHGATGHDEAEPLLRRAIDVLERAEPVDEAVLDGALYHLGCQMVAVGRPAEGREPAERALRNTERRLGPDHPDVADCLIALAKMTEGEPAAALAQRAAQIYEATLGPQHSDLAEALDRLCLALSGLARHDEAAAAGRRALAIDEAVYGADHPRATYRRQRLAPFLERREARRFGAPGGERAGDENAWRILFDTIHTGLADDVRRLLELGPNGRLHAIGLSASARHRALTLTFEPDGQVFLAVRCGTNPALPIDADCRHALLHEHGFVEFDGGDLGAFFGPADQVDAAHVGRLIGFVLINGFRLPSADMDLSWSEPERG